MQLVVYAFAVKEIYGSKPVVGDWFLRSNERVFFNQKTQQKTHNVELAEIVSKTKAGQFGAQRKLGNTTAATKRLCDL